MKRNTKEYAVAGELFYMITYRVFYTILHSNDFSATASTVNQAHEGYFLHIRER